MSDSYPEVVRFIDKTHMKVRLDDLQVNRLCDYVRNRGFDDKPHPDFFEDEFDDEIDVYIHSDDLDRIFMRWKPQSMTRHDWLMFRDYFTSTPFYLFLDWPNDPPEFDHAFLIEKILTRTVDRRCWIRHFAL